jgi:hypothetical protein
MEVRQADGQVELQVRRWLAIDGAVGKKEADLLKRNAADSERILGQVIGNFGQAVVATDHKVLVVKSRHSQTCMRLGYSPMMSSLPRRPNCWPGCK